MDRKRESFFKRWQFIIFLLMIGAVFLTLTKQWDLYEKPIRKLGYRLEDFLGLEFLARNDGDADQGGDPGESGAADPYGNGADLDGDGVLDPQGEQGQNPEDLDGSLPERTVLDEQGIPMWKTVDETYFDDALFIGDSRVVGLRDYGKLAEHATFYAYEGLNVFRLLTAKIVEAPGQHKKISVEEALGERQFAKIYLMTGINELDIGTVDRFENAYRDVVSRIRELQPDAVIYIQGIMLVTEKRANKGDFVTNQGILERNEAIKSIADWQTIFYLEDNEAITDESGGMNPAYTTDGIHLKAKYVPLWTEYLKTHVLSLD